MNERYLLRVFFESEKCYEGFFKSLNQVVKFVLGFDTDRCDFLCFDTFYAKDVDVGEMLSYFNF